MLSTLLALLYERRLAIDVPTLTHFSVANSFQRIWGSKTFPAYSAKVKRARGVSRSDGIRGTEGRNDCKNANGDALAKKVSRSDADGLKRRT